MTAVLAKVHAFKDMWSLALSSECRHVPSSFTLRYYEKMKNATEERWSTYPFPFIQKTLHRFHEKHPWNANHADNEKKYLHDVLSFVKRPVWELFRFVVVFQHKHVDESDQQVLWCLRHFWSEVDPFVEEEDAEVTKDAAEKKNFRNELGENVKKVASMTENWSEK